MQNCIRRHVDFFFQKKKKKKNQKKTNKKKTNKKTTSIDTFHVNCMQQRNNMKYQDLFALKKKINK